MGTEQKRIYDANWRAEHPDYAANWYAAHREQQRTYRTEHPDYIARQRIAQAAWHTKHPSSNNHAAANYRHRKRANGGNFPRAAWEHLKSLFGHRCAYCGRRMERLTQDHIVPISKGGWHFGGNIVPACQSCNSRKGARALKAA